MKIKTHKSTNTYLNNNHFFVLSKGNNAGKPLINPCANCFVFVANNLHEKEYYYWLCFGLWVGGFFRQYLFGSVIPFLRINEFRLVIIEAHNKVNLRREALLDALKILSNLTSHQNTLRKQIELINQAKIAIMYKVLK